MNTQKAIKDLQARVDGEFSIKGIDDCKDMKLGIEALKLYDHNRRIGQHVDPAFLLGETPPKPPRAIGFNTGDDESS